MGTGTLGIYVVSSPPLHVHLSPDHHKVNSLLLYTLSTCGALPCFRQMEPMDHELGLLGQTKPKYIPFPKSVVFNLPNAVTL